MMSPIRHLGFFQAQDMRQPVVSLRMAATSIFTSPLFSMDFFSSATTSEPSTPSHLKPLVQLISSPLSSPFWRTGNEKVKPRGRICSLSLRLLTKAARLAAMWSNNCSPGPSIISLLMAKTSLSISNLQYAFIYIGKEHKRIETVSGSGYANAENQCVIHSSMDEQDWTV